MRPVDRAMANFSLVTQIKQLSKLKQMVSNVCGLRGFWVSTRVVFQFFQS